VPDSNFLFSRREVFLGVAASIAQARALLAGAANPTDDLALGRRREALAILRKVLPPTIRLGDGVRVTPHDKSWEEWIDRTKELPPDFDTMPSRPELPDPLVMEENGRRSRITTVEQWRKQRELLRVGLEKWIYGRMPPPPDNLTGTVKSLRRADDIVFRDVLLEFGPQRKGTLRVALAIPPGKGPFPVLMLNSIRGSGWLNLALRRGYMGCLYATADHSATNPDDSNAWLDLYPEYDFGCLARWAWGAHRAVDYLYTLPFVDKRCIAITGHSRNSKQALLATAFDERITAVIPSRGNSGDARPWRYASTMFADESIEQITEEFPHWFHPRFRFFAGREHKLPVDQNQVLSLVAPRAMLLSHAFTEHQGNVLALEESFKSVQSVYKFLGREDRLGLYQRPGEHAASPEDVEVYLDFLDTAFQRKQYPRPEIWIRQYSYDRWLQQSRESSDPLRHPQRSLGDYLSPPGEAPVQRSADWPARRQSILANLRWALGEEPPGLLARPAQPVEAIAAPPPPSRRSRRSSGPPTPPRPDYFPAMLFERPLWATNSVMGSVRQGFGDSQTSDLYFPAGRDRRPLPGKRFPIVIWLHEYSYATGYSRFSQPIVDALVAKGFAVMAFDQIGFGARVEHVRHFYERFPHWSLLGRMITDTRAAIQSLSSVDYLDSSRIYLCGYALGAKVGLITAAFDERVKGVVSVCGFSPLRSDSPAKGTEGVKHYSHLHGLLPRFGSFAGNEKRLPVDWDEILAVIAPRPAYVIAPTLDRYSPVDDVSAAVSAARKAYRLLGAADALELETPVNFNRFPVEFQERSVDWLAKVAGL
jgi:dienelactone hydrolase